MMINENLFDRYSLAHLGAGFIAKRMGLSFTLTLVCSILFEVIEAQLKTTRPELFPHPSQDTSLNLLGDNIAVMAGWYIG